MAEDDSARQAWIKHARARLGPVDVIALNRASPPSDLASAREVAKAELNAATAAMATIRVSLNALEPACRLPPDVLIQIFLCARESDPPEYSRHGSYYGWLTLTQVCNFWRKTALECRSLWNEMVMSLGPTWAELFAMRSHPSPLLLVHGAKKARYSSGLAGMSRIKESLEHIIKMVPERVAGLEFVAPWSVVEPILSLAFTHATSLTSLATLNLKTDSNYGILQMSGNSFTTPLALLTSLTLPDIVLGVPWTLFPSTLKSLTILGTGYLPKAKESREVLTGVYRLLRRSSELTSLSLNFENLPSWVNVAGKKGLDLPQLRVLKLNGQADGCLGAITSINSLHGLKKLELGITGANWEALSGAAFLPVIQSVSNSPGSGPFLRLSVSGDFTRSVSELQLHAHRATEYNHLVDLNPSKVAQSDPSLSIKFATTEQPIPGGDGRDLMLKLLSSVDVSRLESLHFDVNGLPQIEWTGTDWIDHFRAAREVHYLHVGHDCFSLFYALGSSTESIAPPSEAEDAKRADDALELVTNASEMLFPKLRSLVCERVDFKDVNYKIRIPAHQAFTRALTARLAFSGIPRKITMSYCRLDTEQVKWWATTVPSRMRDWDAESLSARRTYTNSFY